jgi:hypothetical protein
MAACMIFSLPVGRCQQQSNRRAIIIFLYIPVYYIKHYPLVPQPEYPAGSMCDKNVGLASFWSLLAFHAAENCQFTLLISKKTHDVLVASGYEYSSSFQHS